MLTEGTDTLGSSNPWLLQTIPITCTLAHRPISPPPTSALQELPAALYTAMQLSARKTHCTTVQLQQHAVMAMALVAEPDSVIYFTDTSVNPD